MTLSLLRLAVVFGCRWVQWAMVVPRLPNVRPLGGGAAGSVGDWLLGSRAVHMLCILILMRMGTVLVQLCGVFAGG